LLKYVHFAIESQIFNGEDTIWEKYCYLHKYS